MKPLSTFNPRFRSTRPAAMLSRSVPTLLLTALRQNFSSCLWFCTAFSSSCTKLSRSTSHLRDSVRSSARRWLSAPVVGLTVKGLGFSLCIAAYCVDKFLVFVLFPISDGIGYMNEYFVKEVYLYLLSKLSGAVMAPLFAMPGYVA